MPRSDWRSPAAYAHARSISASGFAWEYLRRDEDYRRDYQRAVARSQPALGEEATFADRWGLRFPGRSEPAGRSRDALLDLPAAA